MTYLKMKARKVELQLARIVVIVVSTLLLASTGKAATPGITAAAGGASRFNLTAAANYISQPDGMQIYSWGYGCAGAATYAPATFASVGFCPTMQIPGPTLIVTEGQTVTVTLTNNLPGRANASIVFPGFNVSATGGAAGLQTREALPGGSVTYTFQATTPGTRAYYSGTQPDFQIEMGLYGAVVVLPSSAPGTGTGQCASLGSDIAQVRLGAGNTGHDLRLASAAYNHPETCYDREYLFQFMELDPRIHRQAEEQALAMVTCPPGGTNTTTGDPCPMALNVVTEPYRPAYYLINGRAMPDDMDADYAPNYTHQPYNGNPHMHPGDLVLVRIVGQGRWAHPFHEHGNHVRLLARDGNLILSQNVGTTGRADLAGRMEFTTDTYPGQAMDGIFYWSGKGLGWDIYGHTPAFAGANVPCNPNTSGPNAGFDTSSTAIANGNYFEWCADHHHPLEQNPVGQIASGGPVAQFDSTIATNGLWYAGTPYLGENATTRNKGTTPLAPGKASQNPLQESGIAFMWHSHNEREITTNDIFPGGMLMMMLVDPPDFFIDETL
jgi:FtsP/CotA-like multicopper oxidase with cupredoxin domain